MARAATAALLLLGLACVRPASVPTPDPAPPGGWLPVELEGPGGRVTVLMDTGADVNLLDPAAVAPLGAKATGRDTVRCVGAEPLDAAVLAVPSLRLDGRPIPPFEARALSLRGLSERAGRPIQGLLGWSFFAAGPVELDYPAGRVRLLPALPPPGPGALELPLEVEGHKAFVLAQGPRGPLRLFLDTGNRWPLTVAPADAEAQGWSGLARGGRPHRVTGCGGGRTGVHLAPVPELRLGGLRLDAVPTAFQDTPFPSGSALGGGVLQRYRVTVDVPGRRLRLEPRG